jgi:hypothetical protein
MPRLISFALVFVLLACSPAFAAGPSKERQFRTNGERVRLFLDCVATYCDLDYLRTEITFVDWVRIREDADIHVLVTSQRTGSGGLEYTMRFIGLHRFGGLDQELTHTSVQTDTPDQLRQGFARILSLGLVRYVLNTGDRGHLRIIDDRPPGEAPPPLVPVNDPWNAWVFRARMAMQVESESAYGASATSGFFTANRITDDWKVLTTLDGRYRQARYDLGGDKDYTTVTKNYGARALVVKSLTDRWSAGMRGNASSSNYFNQQFAGRLAPAIEFNVFPYAESTRRRLTLQYAAGVRHFEYLEETIYGLLSETRWDHTFETALDMKQPWGTINTSIDFSQYFFDKDRYRIAFENWIDVRLFRGLSLSVNANASKINNQLYLPRGEATLEEILVRQRQLATSYRYEMSVGVSYTFGSIYNNVVNRRFGG